MVAKKDTPVKKPAAKVKAKPKPPVTSPPPAKTEQPAALLPAFDVNNLTYEQQDGILLFARGIIAGECDDAEGFEAFFWCVYNKDLPMHAKGWIADTYKAKSEGKGRVVEAFRGSAKTTIVTQAFTLFRIGHCPDRSNLLIQVGDDIAKDNTSQMADIIANNKGWKSCFPHVVPDKERGWGDGGYEVKRGDIDYGDWRKQNADRKDPSLVGLGYSSKGIIGKRATGILVIDDINDESNTASAKMSEQVIKILTGTVFPTKSPDAWTIFIGTPWTMNDVLSYVKSIGDYHCTKTPIINADGISAWPERFPTETIESKKRESGTIQFARMYLLDLTAAMGVHLKAEWLHKFPMEKINSSWPCYFGVDYASTADKITGANRDNFTIAIGRALPGGGVVLVDGFIGRLSQGEAEQKLRALAEMYNPALIGIESIGKGEEFYGLMLRTSSLPLFPYKSSKAKGIKFEAQMAPLFESSRAWVSDAETPFLKAFNDEWCGWPNSEHDDTLDAVYYMCRTTAGYLMPAQDTEGFEIKKKAGQAMFAFGRM